MYECKCAFPSGRFNEYLSCGSDQAQFFGKSWLTSAPYCCVVVAACRLWLCLAGRIRCRYKKKQYHLLCKAKTFLFVPGLDREKLPLMQSLLYRKSCPQNRFMARCYDVTALGLAVNLSISADCTSNFIIISRKWLFDLVFNASVQCVKFVCMHTDAWCRYQNILCLSSASSAKTGAEGCTSVCEWCWYQ